MHSGDYYRVPIPGSRVAMPYHPPYQSWEPRPCSCHHEELSGDKQEGAEESRTSPDLDSEERENNGERPVYLD